MSAAASDIKIPDFNTLSAADKKAVAERLLAIQQSSWKPFWCPDPECDGMPHPKYIGEDIAYVGTLEDKGPNGEPLSEIVFEDGDGELYIPGDEGPEKGSRPYGRMVLDPMWAHNHARKDQRLLPWQQRWILFIMSGRGSGKTRTGVEFVTLNARKGLNGAILGRRGTELVNTHVKEIMANAHPEFMPIHWASKDLLEWPNGAITYLFSAEKPENIRSVNLSYAWVDEAAFMDEIVTAWMNLKLATRVKSPGNPIHFLLTSTPQGTPWVMEMEDDEDVTVRRVSTYANRANLDPEFMRDLEKNYEGTRMGRQELHGEVLRDVEGALWNDGMFRPMRMDTASRLQDLIDSMDDIVLAVDPAGSKGPRSDAHGLVVVGVQHHDENGNRLPASQFYVLGDGTIKGSPHDRSAQVFKVARAYDVNRIVVEKNFGGEDVKQGLADYAKLHDQETKNAEGEDFPVKLEHASQSKEVRAEPTVGKYEQGRVFHVTSPGVYGDLSMLEKEQIGWVPKSRGGKMPSPNRVDALVWAVRACESSVRFSGQMAGRNVQSLVKRNAGVGQRPALTRATSRRRVGTTRDLLNMLPR